jgi:hypothetical protein
MELGSRSTAGKAKKKERKKANKKGRKMKKFPVLKSWVSDLTIDWNKFTIRRNRPTLSKFR